MNKKARVLAFYLPQFHPIPENDKYWGKGFTEWTNVGKAKPLFRGHYQPKVPADLGYYDLRLSEIREEQAKLAVEAGIEGFVYWHYWFGNGKTVLERPFQEVLKSGKPDFPFCLGWANHSWTNWNWNSEGSGGKKEFIFEQKYYGIDDFKMHFEYVLPAFKDSRYIKVDGMPLFYVYAPLKINDVSLFIETWQKLAKDSGLKGIYFIGESESYNNNYKKVLDCGFDGVCRSSIWDAQIKMNGQMKQIFLHKFREKFPKIAPLNKISYLKFIKYTDSDIDGLDNIYPMAIPNFDHSPRSQRKGFILTNANPSYFERHLLNILKKIEHKKYENKIVFLKSWNEWGEGNYIEPDLKYGRGYIEVLKRLLT